MNNVKMLKLPTGEEIYGEVFIDELEGKIKIINPVVIYYNTNNELTIGAWLPYSTETEFEFNYKDVMLPPLDVHSVIEENYLKWLVDKNEQNNTEIKVH